MNCEPNTIVPEATSVKVVVSVVMYNERDTFEHEEYSNWVVDKVFLTETAANEYVQMMVKKRKKLRKDFEIDSYLVE